MNTFINLLNAAILAGTPLLLATTGEILTEKSGSLNLGIEGMMYMGAIAGLAGAWYVEQWFGQGGILAVLFAFIFAFVFGALGGLIYAVLTVTLRANQNVTGLTLAIFGTGFGKFFGEVLGHKAGGYVAVNEQTKAMYGRINFGKLADIPVLGTLLFKYNWLVYFAIVIAILVGWFLTKTRRGLSLRAVGESPATADSAGINVTRYRYGAALVGGGLVGLGGMYMSMVDQKGIWVHDCISGYGWLAIALVIFSTWNPIRAILASIIFGGLTVMYMYVPIKGLPIPIYRMFPYIATIVVLIITSAMQIKEHAQPAGTGLNYFREER
ncbi:MAG TPA: ABC transporter permease [Clostridiaceae bacterium]|nr:ABC transporter permease [Clostridiaceae bacterium]